MTEITEPQQVSCLVVTAAKARARRLVSFLTHFPEYTSRSRTLTPDIDADADDTDDADADKDTLLTGLLTGQAFPSADLKFGNTGSYDTQVRIANPQEALTAVSEQLFDAIFLDFRTGDDDSLQLEPLSAIDEFSREAPGVSLIALLEDEQNSQVDKLLERGATDYVYESEFNLPILNRIVRYALSRKQSTNKIFRLLHFDELTGLSTRHLCYDRISQAMIRAERSGQNVAVLLVDLDNFHGINESLGYEVGDFLLKEAANRLVSCVRRQDTVSRFG
ncbi:MAG: diguanylate cyclase, partial [Gammaproteobacteria bacterium]